MTCWDADGAFGLMTGCTAVVGAAFVATAMFTPGEPVARLVVMAFVVAGLTGLTRDWRACGGATVLAVLIFVGFLAGRDGTLTGNPGAWGDAAVIPVAALVGRLGRPHRVPARIPGPRAPARIARRAVAHHAPHKGYG